MRAVPKKRNPFDSGDAGLLPIEYPDSVCYVDTRIFVTGCVWVMTSSIDWIAGTVRLYGIRLDRDDKGLFADLCRSLWLFAGERGACKITDVVPGKAKISEKAEFTRSK